MKKYICLICGHMETSEEVPEICPICFADSSKFVEMNEENKKQYAHFIDIISF